jgi:hypothetical protein
VTSRGATMPSGRYRNVSVFAVGSMGFPARSTSGVRCGPTSAASRIVTVYSTSGVCGSVVSFTCVPPAASSAAVTARDAAFGPTTR